MLTVSQPPMSTSAIRSQQASRIGHLPSALQPSTCNRLNCFSLEARMPHELANLTLFPGAFCIISGEPF